MNTPNMARWGHGHDGHEPGASLKATYHSLDDLVTSFNFSLIFIYLSGKIIHMLGVTDFLDCLRPLLCPSAPKVACRVAFPSRWPGSLRRGKAPRGLLPHLPPSLTTPISSCWLVSEWCIIYRKCGNGILNEQVDFGLIYCVFLGIPVFKNFQFFVTSIIFPQPSWMAK